MQVANPSLTPEEAGLWIGLSLIPGLGSQTYCALLRRFGTPDQIYAASYQDLKSVVPDKIASVIREGLAREHVQDALDWLQQPHNHLITLADADYPRALLEIPDPPPLLYLKGDRARLNVPTIAIVGSRHDTPQGERNAESFAQALSEAGYCIASGLALGIDGAAHRGALQGRAGTIAVVGTGLDIVYPARHRELAHQIVQHGALISEYALGTPSKPQNFPRRNRLISGLSQGCLVVEANLQSGSLITARLAGEQGREVFAIPGSIHSPVAKGCHQLIKQGAKLVDQIQDILDELGNHLPAPKSPTPPAAEHPLLQHMGYDPVSMEALVQRSGLTGDTLSAMLTVLEIEGQITVLPGGRFQRMSS